MQRRQGLHGYCLLFAPHRTQREKINTAAFHKTHKFSRPHNHTLTQAQLTGREKGESRGKVHERAAVQVCMVLKGFRKKKRGYIIEKYCQ